MNYEIKNEDWAAFFESLSKRRYAWKTKIEIVNPDMGDQTLTEGLPFNGVTFETNGEHTMIVISVGESTDAHQTHNIKDPSKVAFLGAARDQGDVIDIEEKDGTKTLITFIEPMDILVGYTKIEFTSTATQGY